MQPRLEETGIEFVSEHTLRRTGRTDGLQKEELISLQSCFKGDQGQFPKIHRKKQAAAPGGGMWWSQYQASPLAKPLTETEGTSASSLRK